MKLSDKQRDKLINLGLNYLINQFDIDSLIGKKVHVKTKKIHRVHRRRMSVKARKAISIRMKKMWAEKNK